MEDDQKGSVEAERALILFGAAISLGIYVIAKTVAELHAWEKKKKEQEKKEEVE